MPSVLPRTLFSDRAHAGAALGDALATGIGGPGIVLGVPRGGIPVALEVARRLGWPMDVMIARKLGVPGLEEVAFGSVAEGLHGDVADPVAAYLGMSGTLERRIIGRERAELERRIALYRGTRQAPNVTGKTVVLVDDGLASGTTIRAAVRSLRRRRPSRIVVAVPVANAEVTAAVQRDADGLVALHSPAPFGMVSDWYDGFDQVTDREVLLALGRSAEPLPASDDGRQPERAQRISLGAGTSLDADLGVPGATAPRGLVILVHGGGSSRMSYRNRFLAGCLREAGWATLRLDLLTPDEQAHELTDGHHRFDIDLVTQRLSGALEWAMNTNVPGVHRIVLFGASTGAAAAVRVAATAPDRVASVMSRAGRVDLAGTHLTQLKAPLLMMVGTRDEFTIRANRVALKSVHGDVHFRLVMRAGHTFEEPGAIGRVERIARRWLDRRFPVGRI
jgi:putative phosphoribosyl transferase